MLNEPHPPLEVAYWVSQVVATGLQFAIVVIGIWAAIAAYRQVDAFKLFELMKFLQNTEFRKARRVVIRDIFPVMNTEWWLDDKLEEAASTCCASYDILGLMLRSEGNARLTAFFVNNWGDSIVRTRLILIPFIERRREDGGYRSEGYGWLFELARTRFPNIGETQPLAQP